MKVLFQILFFSFCFSAFAQNASLVSDLNPMGSGILAGTNTYPNLVKAGNQVFFSGFYQQGNQALWVSDGTAQGTQRLSHDSISLNFAPRDMMAFQGQLYFSAAVSSTGRELYRSDGTVAGTELVKDIAPGSFSSEPNLFCECGGKLFFSANDQGTANPHFVELWETDGTQAGTQLVFDLAIEGSSNPTEAICMDSLLLFAANDGFIGHELWKYNLNDRTVKLVKDINPSGFSTPRHLTLLNGQLFFFADDGMHGFEPWISDGTTAGTHLVHNISPAGGSFGPGMNYPTGMELIVVLDSFAYFSATDIIHGFELWKSNGTASGTQMVKDIRISPTVNFSSHPLFLTVFDGAVWFSAAQPNTGRELWRTDGTTNGTQMFLDLFPSADGAPEWMEVINGKMIFQATRNFQIGTELFETDGTIAGTDMIADINPIGSSAPRYFQAIGDTIVFAAFHHQYDLELWSYIPTSTSIHSDFPNSDLKLYPNPAKEMVHVEITSKKDQSGSIRLYTLSGKLLQSSPILLNPGSHQYPFKLPGISAGMYIIQLSTDVQTWNQKLLVR